LVTDIDPTTAEAAAYRALQVHHKRIGEHPELRVQAHLVASAIVPVVQAQCEAAAREWKAQLETAVDALEDESVMLSAELDRVRDEREALAHQVEMLEERCPSSD
jgi:cell division protein FtsB